MAGKKSRVNSVRVGLIQMAMSTAKQANIKKATLLVKKAAGRGANIICLPELFSTLYFPQKAMDLSALQTAETLEGKTIKLMKRLAKNHRVVLIIPFFEKRSNHYYNTAAVIDEKGNLLGAYRKMHVPHDPLFYERNYFQQGSEGYKIFRTKYGSIAPLICFDQWFPEAARECVLKGADIIFYPTAIGWRRDRKAQDNWLDAWQTIQKSHSIANGVHIASANRAGIEGSLAFWGNSFICDSFGKTLAKASEKEQILLADVDLGNNERVRKGWGFFRSRRPDSYGGIVESAESRIAYPKGYVFPAEWEPHDSVYLGWPHDRITFPKLEMVEKSYAEFIKGIIGKGDEDVNLFVTGKKMLSRAGGMLAQAGANLSRVHFFVHNYVDVWWRDYGPAFIVNRKSRKLAMVKWIFNSWGGKYAELLKDREMPSVMNKKLKLPVFEPGIVLEGGSIEVNGKGTLLTTSQCLLNPNRNPNSAIEDIEKALKNYLGMTKIIWLHDGIVGDDTDGHIDNLARFANPGTILCSFESDKTDINYKPLKRNYELLRSATDQDGKKFTVVKLPMPRLYSGKKRLSANYANFYIANKAVLVPKFNLRTDKQALEIIARQFPDREAIGIDCSQIISGGGTLHCSSQQQPRL